MDASSSLQLAMTVQIWTRQLALNMQVHLIGQLLLQEKKGTLLTVLSLKLMTKMATVLHSQTPEGIFLARVSIFLALWLIVPMVKFLKALMGA